MKKILTIFLFAIIVFSFSACEDINEEALQYLKDKLSGQATSTSDSNYNTTMLNTDISENTPSESDFDEDKTQDTDKNTTEENTDSNTQNSENNTKISFSKNVVIELSSKTIYLAFKNPNNFTSNVLLQLVAQDTLLAKSKNITPGETISKLTLDDDAIKNLKEGKYNGYFILSFYDPITKEKNMVDASIEVSITVQNQISTNLPTIDDTTDKDTSDNSDEQVAQGGANVGFSWSSNVEINLSQKTIQLMFQNPRRSLYNMKLKIKVQNTTIAESKLLKPREMITSLSLSDDIAKKLQEEEYAGQLAISFFNPETGEQVLEDSVVDVTISVKK